jgi:hypothetical protein
VAGKLAVKFLLGKYGLMAKKTSWRPGGRQVGRQISLREIWTYGEKNQLAANWPPSAGRKVGGQVGGKLAVNYPVEK